MARPLLLPFLFIFNSAVAQPGNDTITFTAYRKLMVCQLFINNGKALNFIFDTGAGVTAIDCNTADELGLTTVRTAKIGTAGHQVKSKVSIAGLRIGKTPMDSIQLFAMDLAVFSKAMKVKIDGFIGYDLLKNFTVEVNSDHQYIVLHQADQFVYNGKGSAVHFTKAANKHLVVPASLQTKQNEKIELQMIFDSGSDEAVSLFSHTIQQYHLLQDSGMKTIRSYAADGVPTNNYEGNIPNLKIGSVEWSNIPARYVVDKRNASSTAYTSEESGRIGQAILSDCNITFDYKNSILYIEKIH